MALNLRPEDRDAAALILAASTRRAQIRLADLEALTDWQQSASSDVRRAVLQSHLADASSEAEFEVLLANTLLAATDWVVPMVQLLSHVPGGAPLGSIIARVLGVHGSERVREILDAANEFIAIKAFALQSKEGRSLLRLKERLPWAARGTGLLVDVADPRQVDICEVSVFADRELSIVMDDGVAPPTGVIHAPSVMLLARDR